MWEYLKFTWDYTWEVLRIGIIPLVVLLLFTALKIFVRRYRETHERFKTRESTVISWCREYWNEVRLNKKQINVLLTIFYLWLTWYIVTH